MGALLLVVTAVTLLAWTPEAGAWEAWDSASKADDWCRGCHEGFRTKNLTSLKTGDNTTVWSSDRMTVHSADWLGGTCNACHGDAAGGANKNPVFMDESADTTLAVPQAGCMGCHGREADANSVADTGGTDAFPGNDTVPLGTLSPSNSTPARGVGAGLRQAHFVANVTMTHTILGSISTQICIECHFDSNPANFTTAAETTLPPHYITPPSATSPSNPCDIGTPGESLVGTLGLDNDGDGLTDITQGDADCLVNNAPTANAGPDQTVFVSSLVTLDGSLSSDLDADPLTYAWSFASVPTGSLVTLTGATTVNPTFTPDLPGTYDVQLVVNDGTVNSTPDNVLITTQNSAPVANAGPDQTVFVDDTVTLDGSGSSDADGDLLTYAWSFTSVPTGSTAAMTGPTTLNPTFVVDLPGTYSVQLVVNDGTVNSAADVVNITTSNSAPVANAGSDQTVFVDDTVTLDGSGSSDADGDPLTFSWSFTSVPTGSLAVLTGATTVGPTFVVDLPGTYVVSLTVNDGTVNSTADAVSITTQNSAPVANAGIDQSVLVNDLVTLDGSGSSDVDGDALTYSWSFTAVPTGSTATLTGPTTVGPTFTADLAGTYTVQLIVNDGTVNSAADTVNIVAGSGNTAPVANAGPDQTVFVDDTVLLDGSGSSDADLDPLTYSWSFSSVPTGSTATLVNATTVSPSFVVDLAGTYVVQLVVNDGVLDSAPDQVVITTANSAPVANAGPNQSVLVNDLVTLDGSGSSDADLDPLTYSWSFSSVPTGSLAALTGPTTVAPTFTVDLAGTYVVQLIVNDGTVNSAPDSVSITTANSAPVANAGPDQTVALGATVTLDGSGSSDADLDPLTYSWSLSSVPTGSTAALTGPTTVNPTFVADLAGSYVVQLIVNDGTVNSAADSVVVNTANTTPVANAGPDQSIVDGGLVTLDGSGSSDADGDPLTYSWAFTALPVGSTAALSGAATVNPTFTADEAGVYTVRLIVNDGTTNSTADFVDITNTVTGTVPNIVLSPTSFDFGSVVVGTTQTGYVAIQNNGDDVLAVSGLSLSGLDAGDFTIVGPATPFNVLRDLQTLVEFTYTPGAAAVDNASLDVASNDPDTPTASALLSGTGVAAVPDINLPSATLAFGDVEELTTQTASVVVENVGTGTLNISSATLGANPDFAVTSAPTSIAAGFSATVEVAYTPSAIGADAETLTIASDDPDEPSVTVAVSGNGIAATAVADINLPSATLAFGDVAELTTQTASVVVENVGTATLNISSATLGANPDFAVTSAPTSIAAGFSATVEVAYTPSAIGADAETLTIASDDPDEPSVTVAVSGNGIAAVNTTPVAHAGADQSGLIGQTVALDGSASTDADGDPLTYAWSFASEPVGSLAALTGPTTVNPTFVPDLAGAYDVQLIVNDGTAGSLADVVQVVVTAPVADINLPSATLAFGNVEVGSTVTGSVVVQNVGTATLNVSGLSLTGLNADFAMVTAAPVSIAAGFSASIEVAYTPSAIAADTDTLTIASDDPDEGSVTVAVSGSGIAATAVADINLPSATLAFGNVEVGSTVTGSVVVQNVGTATLNVSGLSLTGLNADFAMVTAAPVSIAAGFSASIEVAYTPSAIGADAETLTIASDDPDEPSVTVAVSGNGIAAGNTTPVAHAGADQSGLIGQTVALDGSASTDADGDPLTYAWSFASVPVGSLAALTGPTTVDPTFVPDVAGAYDVQLIVNDGTAGSLADVVQVVVTAPVADINLPSATLAFGDVTELTTQTASVVVQNVGTATLNIGSATLGANPDFAVTSAPTSIAAGFSATVEVAYTPSAIGADAETLTIASDDPDEPSVTVAVSGSGIAAVAGVADINLSPATLDFGSVSVGSVVRDSMNIQNLGTGDLTISALTPTGSGDFVVLSSTATPITVRPGRQFKVRYAYTPSTAGPAVGTLDIVSNDPDESPISLSLSGTGQAGVADINLPVVTVDFGSVTIGATQKDFVAIQNVGTADFDVTGLGITGSVFTTTHTVPFTVRAGRQVKVQIAFAPTVAGPVTDTLTVTSTSPGETSLPVTLDGIGLAGEPDINLPAPLAFGDVEVGATVSGSVVVENVGTATLNISGLSLTGGNADFTLVTAAPVAIAAGFSALVEVAYTPSAAAADAETLQFVSDDPDESPTTVAVSGNGIATTAVPDINLPTVAVNYGDVVVDQTQSVSVAIQNVGTADLNVTSMTLSGSPDFTTGHAAAFVVPAGRQVTVQIDYTPTAAGADAGSLDIVSDDPDESPISVSLSGNGVAGVADINLPVVTFDFGDVVTGTTATGYVAIQNVGTGTLNVSNVALAGTNADFVIVGSTSFTILPGRQVTVRVDYTPDLVEVDGETMTITSDSPGETSLTVDILGNGAPAV